MIFKEVITMYCENHIKHPNMFCGENVVFFNVQAGGANSYHCALKGLNKAIYREYKGFSHSGNLA
jgi:hypothetical protein